MIVLVDIDSTITNFGEILLLANNQSHGTCYRYTDITSYAWFDETFYTPGKTTEDQCFWNGVEVNPAEVTAIERWVRQGHKVYLCTASHFNNMLGYKIKRTLDSFNSELINERNIIIAQDKSAIMGDAMIDDCIDNLVNFNGTRICYAQPWNREYRGSRNCSWEAIDKSIQHTNFCFYEEYDVAF